MRNALIVALVSAGILTAADARAADTIKFALAAPLTGDTAAQGLQDRAGAELAVAEINATGGVKGKKLEMTAFDDQANPQQATIVAAKIASEGDYLFVLGHNNSGCSLAGLPAYANVGLPVISPANTAPTLTDLGYKNYFRIIANDLLTAQQLADLGVKEKGLKKAGILWENTDYGKSLHDLIESALKSRGVQIVGDESFVPGVDRDYSAQLTKFKGAGVDSIYMMTEYTASALILKQARTLGLQAQAFGSSGASNPKLIELAGPAAEGAIVVSAFDPNDQRPKQVAFIQKFMGKKNGERPGEWGAHSYDIVYLVKAAIESGATDRASLITKLHALKGFEGVTGLTEFNDKGDVPGKKMVTLRVENGKFVYFKPTKY